MPITKETIAARWRSRHDLKMRHADLAEGKGIVEPTYARFLAADVDVEDYRYVADEAGPLIKQAQDRLMWGHRLHQSTSPFAELMFRIDRALDKVEPFDLTGTNKGENPYSNTDWEWMRRMRDIRMGRIPYPPAPSRLKAIERMNKQPAKRRKKLKNRTREERIADLRAALAKQE